MRVIGGSLKKRKLFTPGKTDTRPTPDRVREALFSSLGDAIFDSSFLDLFSGTGAVGIEAVSRGVSRVSMVEKDRRSMDLIKRNLDLCNISADKARTIQKDVLVILKDFYLKKDGFDYIFLDPPYHTDLAEKCIDLLSKYPILNASGKIIIEHYFKRELPQKTDEYIRVKQMRYGETVLSYYIRVLKQSR